MVGVDDGRTVAVAIGETEGVGEDDGRAVCVSDAICVVVVPADGEGTASGGKVSLGAAVGGTGRDEVRVGARNGAPDGVTDAVGMSDGVVPGDAMSSTGVLA